MRLRPLLLLAVVVVVAGCRTAARNVSLAAERGHPTVLAFIDTQAGPSAAGNPSRSQLVVLKSMDTQSSRYGLRTTIVDTSHAGRAALVNFRFDWSLPRSIKVVGDAGGSLARAYSVTHVPTTILVDKRGVVVRRWNRFALPAELDFAIRKLTGRSIFSR